MLPPYERMGLLYLGRRFDLDAGTRLPEPVLYESKDLVTHAVCIGMTGSGKTGLGVIVIEEAALDGIPVIAIDPKGDLSNLLLTFPGLAPSDFIPWLDRPDASADATAAAWKAGLAEWDQDGQRIARLKAAADVRVYTPGSRTGTPLSLLRTLRVQTGQDEEDASRRATTIAASLLSLAGVPDIALHSREQALLAAILSYAGDGGPSDLPWLVQQIQRPSFERVGVLDLETFYPARERQELALRFNSVLATPGFDLWTKGEPLDAASLLYTPDGRPRIAIVSISHLDDQQRMMVVSLLLGAVLEWSRRQSGTSSLRALLYLDEVFGYLPPVSNPPSKLPLLTLLKQARASGLGVMLATQNPVDLDYKALSNTGTWFLGKLQTERDKARVLDGLEGVSGGMSRQQLDRTLSALRPRVFLMHNVHEHGPVVFETRWALSYLRGPLTRDELRRAAGTVTEAPASSPVRDGGGKPVLPAGIDEYFLPSSEEFSGYLPVLYGSARIHYRDTRRGVDLAADVHAVTPLVEGALAADWDSAANVPWSPDALRRTPDNATAGFGSLPSDALNPRKYRDWMKDFERWVARARPLRLLSAPAFKLHSRPGEAEAEFVVRVQQAGREMRDAAVEKLRDRYAPKAARAADNVARTSEAVAREEQHMQHQKLQTAVSFGATLLGALMGRKAVSATTLGRATTAARGVGRSVKEAEDVARAKERQREAEAALQEMEAELKQDIEAIESPAAADITIETVEIPAKAGAVDVRLLALAWVPDGAVSSSRPAASRGSATPPTPRH
jgi:hypothetical protein